MMSQSGPLLVLTWSVLGPVGRRPMLLVFLFLFGLNVVNHLKYKRGI